MSLQKFADALGVIGIPISCFLFASQVSMMRKAWKSKNADQLSPYPTLALMGNCIFWTFYSGLHVQRADLTIVNFIGCLFQIAYSVVFLRCLSPVKKRRFAVIMGAIVGSGILITAILYGFKVPNRGPILGGIAVAFNICLFISPLDAIRAALKSLDTTNVPLFLVIVSLSASTLWFTFALCLETPDAFIAAPNAIGIILSVLQLSLLQYIRIKRKEKGLDQIGLPHTIPPDPTVAVSVPDEAPVVAFAAEAPIADSSTASLAPAGEIVVDTTVITVVEPTTKD